MILAIYGAHGLAREVYIVAKKINAIENRWNELCYIDDVNDITEVCGVKVYKFANLIEEKIKNEIEVVIAVGEPAIREIMYNKVITENIKLATIIHPGVYIDETTKIGEGVVIGEGATITCNVNIGDNSVIQPHAVIGHDNCIGKNSVIGSNAQIGGACVIGDRVFMGFLSGTRDRISIGDDVILAPGAIAFKDVPAKMTAVGNPARVVKKNDDGRVF